MNNKNYKKLGGLMMIVFIIGILNALGDIYVLLRGITHTADVTGGIFLNALFFGVFANRTLLPVFTPLTLIGTVLCLAAIVKRKLKLLKISFLAACIIGLVHLAITLTILTPSAFVDAIFSVYRGTFPFVIAAGAVGALGALFGCMVYLRRSERVAVYFNNGSEAKQLRL